MKKRDYSLHSLSDTEFEDLVVRICSRWFGEGVTGFAKGRDGGRDARFNGQANSYPSASGAWVGQTVIQAKHTATPNASCSDTSFQKYYQEGHKDSELPKIQRLIKDNILDQYIIFTNRKLAGGADENTLRAIKACGMKDADIVGLEKITLFLQDNPDIARELPNAVDDKPFEFDPNEMVEVITGVQEVISLNGSNPFDSELDFTLVNKKKVKNSINKMSDAYFENVVVNQFSMHFDQMNTFLKNIRNDEYRRMYHDIADELRQKIIVFRERFEAFEEIILFLFEEVRQSRPDLRTRRRYITFLLCYMYYDCDIGEREPRSC